jgi:hypothetical protein
LRVSDDDIGNGRKIPTSSEHARKLFAATCSHSHHLSTDEALMAVSFHLLRVFWRNGGKYRATNTNDANASNAEVYTYVDLLQN